jgi:hypothetical protein
MGSPEMPIRSARLAAACDVPALLEVFQVAHRLGLSPESVRRLLRDKREDRRLVAIHLGNRWRIDPRDLEAYIVAHRQSTGPQNFLTARECADEIERTVEWIHRAITEGVTVHGVLVKLQADTILTTNGRRVSRIALVNFRAFLVRIGLR